MARRLWSKSGPVPSSARSFSLRRAAGVSAEGRFAAGEQNRQFGGGARKSAGTHPAACAWASPVGDRPHSSNTPFSSVLTILPASFALLRPCRMSLRARFSELRMYLQHGSDAAMAAASFRRLSSVHATGGPTSRL